MRDSTWSTLSVQPSQPSGFDAVFPAPDLDATFPSPERSETAIPVAFERYWGGLGIDGPLPPDSRRGLHLHTNQLAPLPQLINCLILVISVLASIPGENPHALGQVVIPRLDPVLQVPFRYELGQAAQFDLIDGVTRARLALLDDYLREKHWQEAQTILRERIEENDRRLIPVTPSRLIPVADWCRIRLGHLPLEALKAYRAQIDPVAEQLLEEARREHDPDRYQEVLDRAFASTASAEAALALGDLALERGQYCLARAWWQLALPPHMAEDPSAGRWPSIPAPSIPPVAVRSRLVLASILERDFTRAEAELNAFEKLHAGEETFIAGKVQPAAEALRQLLEQTRNLGDQIDHRSEVSRAEVSTFAGGAHRFSPVRGDVLPLAPVWRKKLPAQSLSTSLVGIMSERTFRSAGNSAQMPLGYHPCVVGGHVYLATAGEILAWKLASGEPAWPGGPSIYRDPSLDEPFLLDQTGGYFGIPQFTLTVQGNRLFARMGSPVTIRSPETRTTPVATTSLVCLDLEAQGRLVWRQVPPDPQGYFEGSPLVDGDRVFILVRKNEVHSQLWVAAYEAATGRLLWRKLVCGGEPLGRLTIPEISHVLLTAAEGHLYFCTNLGALVGMTTEGDIRWVVTYPRKRRVDLSDLPPHWLRQPNCVLYHRGVVYAAPADCAMILAVDAMTGQLLWHTGEETGAATFLLGVVGDRLIACGGKIFWIATSGPEMGRVVAAWPDSAETPGFGRGILVDKFVLWPTKDRLYVFDPATGQPKKVLPLAPWGTAGGNLVLARGHLLIAGPAQLTVLRIGAQIPAEPSSEVASLFERFPSQLSTNPSGSFFQFCRALWPPEEAFSR
ncbi:MAG: PQQ-like beta-propeller repeat protein [Thermoguttaceae bacterium]|nr:PQQ-like beta-propeller repeat protein [Thermoguttaceae bacterium]